MLLFGFDWPNKYLVSRIMQYKSERNLSYIFVAYTAEQFSSNEDFRVLHQMADAAARNAGVMAYWVGCSCMPELDQLQEDVSLMCHSLFAHDH